MSVRVHVCVLACACMHGHSCVGRCSKARVGVLLYCSWLYSFDTRSISEPASLPFWLGSLASGLPGSVSVPQF